MEATLTDEEIKSLTQSILLRYGIDFTCYEPKSLRRRIIHVMNVFKITAMHELWIRFLRDQNFIYNFMNEVSVGMTSMFRDPIFWKHLRNYSRKEFSVKDNFSIWHAGCSTGEEVYSMGILLQETGMLKKSTAWATDINKDAIEVARNGEYHKIKMIENERNYKEYNAFSDFYKYTKPVDGKNLKMDLSLTNHVTYDYHNLINDNFAQKFDLILCRNVMIYFDNGAKRKILEKFYKALNPGGFFVIGFYDTMLSIIDQKLFTLVDEEAKIFQKVV
jgi:chemotaxis protein methyltransferase CheR